MTLKHYFAGLLLALATTQSVLGSATPITTEVDAKALPSALRLATATKIAVGAVALPGKDPVDDATLTVDIMDLRAMITEPELRVHPLTARLTPDILGDAFVTSTYDPLRGREGQFKSITFHDVGTVLLPDRTGPCLRTPEQRMNEANLSLDRSEAELKEASSFLLTMINPEIAPLEKTALIHTKMRLPLTLMELLKPRGMLMFKGFGIEERLFNTHMVKWLGMDLKTYIISLETALKLTGFQNVMVKVGKTNVPGSVQLTFLATKPEGELKLLRAEEAPYEKKSEGAGGAGRVGVVGGIGGAGGTVGVGPAVEKPAPAKQ